MSYPDAVNLPFNGAVIREGFRPALPGDTFAGSGMWLVLRGGALVVQREGEGRKAVTGDRPGWLPADVSPLCIGTWHGAAVWAAAAPRDLALPDEVCAESFNAAEERLDDRLLSLGGFAQQVLHWVRDSARCSRCGGENEARHGTWGRLCRQCGAEHFPHIHPCAIVLVRRGDEFLLGRKREWPAGRYSLVAGFLDFGESLEECAAREVREETSVEVRNVRYVGSQNWPFPSQLMAGFVAEYGGGDIRVDGEELEDARWFCAQHMPASLPGKRSIARWIIDTYALRIG